MPKVSSFYVEIDNEPMKFDIHYNQKKRFHVTSFPDRVLTLSAHENSVATEGFDTEKLLVDHFREIVNIYHEKIASSKKVIAYKLYGSSEIVMNKVGDHSFSGFRNGISKRVDTDGSGYSIGFDYIVLLETTKNGKRYNEVNMDGSIGYDRDYIRHNEWTIIDWTAEREQAFVMLADGMYSLMVKICAALGSEKKAIAFLDSKVKLLN